MIGLEEISKEYLDGSQEVYETQDYVQSGSCPLGVVPPNQDSGWSRRRRQQLGRSSGELPSLFEHISFRDLLAILVGEPMCLWFANFRCLGRSGSGLTLGPEHVPSVLVPRRQLNAEVALRREAVEASTAVKV